MTPKQNNGGPAFPFFQQVQLKPGDDLINYKGKGMTLRDWFAGQALAHVNPAYTVEEIAEGVYKLADAMLKERGK